MRFIHLPYPGGGNPWGLSKALNELGHVSHVWILKGDWLAYPSDRVFVKRNWKSPILRTVEKEFAKFSMLRYVFNCDVAMFSYGSTVFCPRRAGFPGGWGGAPLWFIYNFYQGVMQLVEVSILKLLKKRIVVFFHGDDARRGKYSRDHFAVSIASSVPKTYYSTAGDWVKAYQARLFDLCADQIYYLNPDLGHVLPKRAKFLPYAISLPEDNLPPKNGSSGGELVVGHAPTSRTVKGTDEIIAAYSFLQQSAVATQLHLVENMPNADALRKYLSFDLFIDQIYAGWYGGVAVEVMSMGIPVVAYIRQSDLSFIPEGMRAELPVISADASTLVEALERLSQSSSLELSALGERSRQFARKWHSTAAIASEILGDIADL